MPKPAKARPRRASVDGSGTETPVEFMTIREAMSKTGPGVNLPR
jgi:hypothetical protein